MTIFQDNISPYISFVEGAAPASPAATNFRLFYDSADHLLKWKNSAGTVTTLATGSGLADQGVFTYLDGTVAAAPGTPAAGKLRMYAKTGKVLAVKDDAGVETVLGAGGGSAGALVFLEAHTASASASLDFTTFISSTYDEYKIEMVGVLVATDSADLYLEVGTGAGPTWDTTGGNYSSQIFGVTNAGSSVGVYQNPGVPKIASAMSSTTDYAGLTGHLTFALPQSTTQRRDFIGQGTYVWTTGGLAVVSAGLGVQYTPLGTALTGLRFIASSGNITSGVIRIYGVSKS